MEVNEKAFLNNYIRIYDEICEKEFHKKLFLYSKNNPFNDGLDAEIVGDGNNIVNKKIRDCSQESLGPDYSNSMTNIYIFNFIGFKFVSYLKRYIEDCGIGDVMGSTGIEELILLRYKEHGHYKRHIDSGTHTMRTLSLIYFINDNYEGGEIEFSLPYNENLKSTVKPKSNRLIIFPSNFLYPHKVLPVKKDKRFTIVAWTR